MFDELKILITGDTSGIETTMKRALNVVQGGVKQMNAQEVDWTGIFSRAVSPAIISGVASVFAFAISQAVNFQTALATTGTAAGESTSQIGALSQSALNLSRTVPSSAQDIATAMTQVSAILSDTSDQQEVVTAMAQLAAAGFGNLSDIVAAAVPIFKQFGVTTADEAVKVLTDLMHGAEAAKESIPDLAHQFTTFSDQLPGANKSVTTFNGLLSTFAAEVQNLGSAGAMQIFSALATSATSAVGPMELLGTSFSAVQKSLLTDGGLTAIQKTSEALDHMGPGAALIATNFGLSATQVGQFQTNASKLPKIASDALAISKNTQTITDAFRQADVGTNVLLTDWNKIVKVGIDMGTAFTPLLHLLANIFVNAAEDAEAFFTDVTDGFSSMLSLFYGNSLKSAVTGTFKGLASAFDDIVGKPAQQLINGIQGVFTGSSANGLNSALQSTGVNGFSSGVLSRIDQTASQNGLIDSLTSALQSGIKSGQYTQLVNTFHLTVPAGSQGLTAKAIAQQLYNQFQGTQ